MALNSRTRTLGGMYRLSTQVAAQMGSELSTEVSRSRIFGWDYISIEQSVAFTDSATPPSSQTTSG